MADQMEPLHLSIRIDEQLNRPEKTNPKDTRNGWTALHLAARYGHDKLVARLLGRYEPDNSKLPTPLRLAAEHGHVKVVAQILARHHELLEEPTQDEKGWTALHFAAHNGHSEVLACLLAHNADTDRKTNDSMTALHLAVRAGHGELVEQLITRGSLEPIMNIGKTALHFAVESGNAQIVALLLAHSPESVAAVVKGGLTAMHLAADCGHDDIVAQLIAHRPSLVAEPDDSGRTALHFAVENGFETIAIQLLDQDPKLLNTMDSSGDSALRIAARLGDVDMVAVLLAREPAVDCCRFVVMLRDLRPPLPHSEKIMDMLLAHNPDLVNYVARDGDTVLHSVLYPDNELKYFSTDLILRVWQLNPTAVHARNAYEATPFFMAVGGKLDQVVDKMQWKFSIDEIVEEFTSCYQPRSPLERLRPLVEGQCEALAAVLCQDVMKIVYDYSNLGSALDFLTTFLTTQYDL